jgi:DNA-directed RNA polymerase specialized sigma24 family protein
VGTSPDRLTVLFGTYYRPLVRLAAHLTAGEDAEDVVQDAYVRVLRHWGAGRDPARAERRLRQAVVKRARRSHATEPQLPVPAALAALPRREREAVVLRLYADLSEAQAADAMGTSSAAVRHLTATAVDVLSTLTDEEAPAEEAVRQLLHDSDAVDLRADGLDRIRRRLAARRSQVLRPAVSLAGLVLAGVAGTYAVAATDGGPALPTPRAPQSSSPEPSQCSGGLCMEPDPSPTAATRVIVAAGAALVAMQDGRVVLADGRTGETIQQLSQPDGGDVDSDPARGAKDGVVWVRTRADGCTSSLLRTGLAGGASGITVDARPRRRRLPALSDGGRTLAWGEGECAPGPPDSIVVRGPDARFLTVAAAPDAVTALDVRDDGAALVGLADRSYLVQPGTTSVSDAIPLRAAAGCAVVAPAWDGAVATAWQRCAGRSRLTRFDARGVAVSSSVHVPGSVTRTTIARRLVLLVRADGTPARVDGGSIVPIPGGERLAHASW